MRYELMLPHQIREAIDKNWPCVLPLGVLEYHGEHLSFGMDTIVVVRMLELIEKEMDLVILPPFYYGAASYAVARPERNGTVHVDSGDLLPFARGLFRGLIRVGFRNIHFFVHHQSENFEAGMPTDLAFKLAARQAIFEFLEKERGEGWWGQASAADYYGAHEKGENPFNWIQGHPLMDDAIIGQYPFDHAGPGETSLLMALCPDAVDMGRFDDVGWYSRGAKEASTALGNRGRDLVLEHMRRILRKA